MLFADKDVLEFENKIHQAKDIVLLTHFNPDGDAIGSCVGLYHYLKTKNKELHIISPNEFPHFLDYLIEDVPYVLGSKETDKAKHLLNNSDLIICLDFNTSSRVGDALSETLNNTKVDKILIDHHLNPESTYKIVFSHPPSSSTCEIVYELILHLNQYKPFLNKEIAQALYTGICTDTGSFSFGCNHRRCYEIVGDLVENGADVEFVHQEVFNTNSENRLRLLGFCLCERMTVIPEKKTAFIYLSKSDLKRFHFQIGDTEGIVNYCLSIKGIEFGILVTERIDRVRLSFRSKYNFDVNKFAREYWNGGGHRKASGGHEFDSLENVVKKLREQINTLDL